MSAPTQMPGQSDHVSRAKRARSGLLGWVDLADLRLIDAALMAALVIAATCLYSIYAWRVGSFQPDEWYYMEVSRAIVKNFPAGLWQPGIYWRGVQRLDQLYLAAPFAFLRGAAIYEVAHVMQALLFASTAIPVWMLGRVGGLRSLPRWLATAIVLAAPWAIVSTSFLAESAAYPSFAWVLYTTWLVANQPSRARELLAIVVLVIAALSRTALLAMAPILPAALIWQQWRWELRTKRWHSRIRVLPRQLWSCHPIVTAITAAGLAIVVLSTLGALPDGGLAALTGSYGLPTANLLTGLLERYDYYLSRVFIGTGGIAMVFGLAWTLRTIWRPREGGRHALAVVSVLGVGVMLLSLVQAGADERYVLYGAIPIALTFAAELDFNWREARSAGAASVIELALSYLAAAAAVIVIFSVASWPTALSEYDFFTYPAATFYARVALTRLTALPAHLTATDLVDGVIAITALGWLVALGQRHLRRPTIAVAGILVLAVCGLELVYSLEKFTTTPAAAADGTSAGQRSWLEPLVAPGVHVAAVGIGLGGGPAYVPIWRTAEFWNTAVDAGVGFAPWDVPTLPFDGEARVIAVQSPSGRLRVTSPTAAEAGHALSVPRYLLLPRQSTNPEGFVAKLVAYAPVLPLELVQLQGPARLEWSLTGVSEEGFMSPGKLASATVYQGGLHGEPRCARLALIAPATYYGPNFRGSWPYTVSSGSDVTHGRLRGGETRSVQVPLRPARVAGGRIATVMIDVHGEAKYVTGAYVSARVADFSVGACGHPGQ